MQVAGMQAAGMQVVGMLAATVGALLVPGTLVVADMVVAGMPAAGTMISLQTLRRPARVRLMGWQHSWQTRSHRPKPTALPVRTTSLLRMPLPCRQMAVLPTGTQVAGAQVVGTQVAGMHAGGKEDTVLAGALLVDGMPEVATWADVGMQVVGTWTSQTPMGFATQRPTPPMTHQGWRSWLPTRSCHPGLPTRTRFPWTRC